MSVTGKGRKAIGDNNGQSERHGGIEHQYWKKRIAERLKDLGYEVEQEVPIGGGKAVDLVANRNEKRIAMEIETGKSDAAANVRKCIDGGFDPILSVATTPEAKRAIERQLRDRSIPSETVGVLSGRDVLRAGLPDDKPARRPQ